MGNLLTSWKTTVTGVIVVIIGIYLLANFSSNQAVMAIGIGFLPLGVGLIAAKDGGVTGIGAKATTDPAKDGTQPPAPKV